MLADVEPTELMGVATGFFLVVVVPIVFALLHHQRKMAEFLHRRVDADEPQQRQIDRLEHEVRKLKDRINHLILQGEDRRALQERVSPPEIPDQLR